MTTITDLSVLPVSIGNTESVSLVSNTVAQSVTASIVDANLDVLHELTAELAADGVTATIILPDTATNLAKYRGTILQVKWVINDTTVNNTRLNLVGNLVKETSTSVNVVNSNGSTVTVSTGGGGGTPLTEAEVDGFVANNGYLTDIIGDTSPQLGGNLDTNNFLVSYDNGTSGLTSSDMKSAIDELNALYTHLLTRDQVALANFGTQNMNQNAVATLTTESLGTGWVPGAAEAYQITVPVDYVEFEVHVHQRIADTLDGERPAPMLVLEESADGTTWTVVTKSATGYIRDASDHEDSSNNIDWYIPNPPVGQQYRISKEQDSTLGSVVGAVTGQFRATIRISQ